MEVLEGRESLVVPIVHRARGTADHVVDCLLKRYILQSSGQSYSQIGNVQYSPGLSFLSPYRPTLDTFYFRVLHIIR